MVTTRGGADSSQPKLDDLKGVSVKRKTGGGAKAGEVPTKGVEESQAKRSKTVAGEEAGQNWSIASLSVLKIWWKAALSWRRLHAHPFS